MELKYIIESLIFASDKPISHKQLKALTDVADVSLLNEALEGLQQEYQNKGIQLAEVGGGYQFRTHPDNAPWVKRLLSGRPPRLTQATLETLAIIAYRQPITRPEIEDIRGVDCGGVIRLLLERGLIRIVGKKEEVGRPILYGSTKQFLEFFNLRDLKELPTLKEFTELSEENADKLTQEYGESQEGIVAGEETVTATATAATTEESISPDTTAHEDSSTNTLPKLETAIDDKKLSPEKSDEEMSVSTALDMGSPAGTDKLETEKASDEKRPSLRSLELIGEVTTPAPSSLEENLTTEQSEEGDEINLTTENKNKDQTGAQIKAIMLNNDAKQGRPTKPVTNTWLKNGKPSVEDEEEEDGVLSSLDRALDQVDHIMRSHQQQEKDRLKEMMESFAGSLEDSPPDKPEKKKEREPSKTAPPSTSSIEEPEEQVDSIPQDS